MNRRHPALLALSLFTVTFAVNLQAPLYPAYVAQSGHGTLAATLAFAAYVAGLMPTLVFLGGLSDRIGRRGPLALALALGAAATLLLGVSPGWPQLVLARVLLGVGTGLATTSGTAYMVELMGEAPARTAALWVTSSTSLGFGGGALATGISLSVQGPSFMPASFWALLLAVPALMAACIALPRASAHRQTSIMRLPVFPSGSAPYGVAMALAWASTGMTIAVIPMLLSHYGLSHWSGAVIFLALFVGFLCQPLARRMRNRSALILGIALIPLGFACLLTGAGSQSIWLILAGTALTSASSYGFTYLSALSEVSLSAPDNRARATAGLLIYAYAGFSLPVILAGAAADRLGLVQSMAGFFVVQSISVCALAVLLRCRERRRSPVWA